MARVDVREWITQQFQAVGQSGIEFSRDDILSILTEKGIKSSNKFGKILADNGDLQSALDAFFVKREAKKEERGYKIAATILGHKYAAEEFFKLTSEVVAGTTSVKDEAELKSKFAKRFSDRVKAEDTEADKLPDSTTKTSLAAKLAILLKYDDNQSWDAIPGNPKQ